MCTVGYVADGTVFVEPEQTRAGCTWCGRRGDAFRLLVRGMTTFQLSHLRL